MVCFTKTKGKKGKLKKKKGMSIEYLLMVEMKPLVESRIFFFLVYVRLEKALFSGSWHGRDIYALAWAGR